MTSHIDIQNVSKQRLPLTRAEITRVALLVLRDHQHPAELTIRLVDTEEMIALNHQYRQQNKLTNVLAFPGTLPEGIILEYDFLGDVIICPEVMRTESKQQGKTLQAHWSLILIHGVLHLLGYDHIKSSDARIMQAIEIKLLDELGYDNPYDVEDTELE